MVPTGKHVQDVYVGEGKSVLNALKTMNEEQRAATLCIDQSTIEQSVSKAVALKLREADADLVDAPVSGGKVKVSTLVTTLTSIKASWVQRKALWRLWSEDPRFHLTSLSLFSSPCLARLLTAEILVQDLPRRSQISAHATLFSLC